jgi:hypothetical protein
LVDLSGIKRELGEVIESKFFPFYCVIGGAVAYAFTKDILWILVGIGTMVYFLFRRR